MMLGTMFTHTQGVPWVRTTLDNTLADPTSGMKCKDASFLALHSSTSTASPLHCNYYNCTELLHWCTHCIHTAFQFMPAFLLLIIHPSHHYAARQCGILYIHCATYSKSDLPQGRICTHDADAALPLPTTGALMTPRSRRSRYRATRSRMLGATSADTSSSMLPTR